ncbi:MULTISPECIES: thiamine pyrophosphate-binding protein [Legionella]|uniref:pyruvate decarboxylase n=1 Tax=Legionella septentrionalis TaxID=2498109 RepID=A0A433JN75_9GAMM|nr:MULTISPECIES: thiamine pyrophosphate-binding protein [Legionella]MCP0913113.1 thiamine pyrophosphate-binding protein [Legionella sp. 27cVA30]RUQ91563.1 pyruvate decarboxylase [Legionella septentrionalis]RUQ94692.1 pyruvate decarboxylase [Legionella septentrionalis]RUR10613.1 pyruvate decarboxylase [Legionella septentrionalis]RUR17158.1 pyruvate decarboxylase [Legionella septentrionalis]
MHTIGGYLAKRLRDLAIRNCFAIPGDYNLVLLDEVIKNKDLHMIYCCNELNAGYAADGYARVHGVSALFLTFSVGGLSAMNAIAGAFAENLPVIVVSGGPNTNSIQDAEILHHTLANDDLLFVRDMYARITAHSVRIHQPKHAALQIDAAIAQAIQKKKPVYIEIACNLANYPISDPTERAFNVIKKSDSSSLQAAVRHAAEKLNQARKPLLILGSKTRACEAVAAANELSLATGYALAAMPDAKGFISEQHPNFIGIYWGPVSSPGCAEVVDSSDAYLLIGANENDYTTVGHRWGITLLKTVSISEGQVCIGQCVYTDVFMHDFLKGLQKELQFNDNSLRAYQRIAGEAPLYNEVTPDAQGSISTRYLFAQIQNILSNQFSILAETGDSWFNCMRLKLPEGCGFEIQMQYGSIGWSVGALLGMQAALADKKRVIACIGDGSFQMSAQELSTIIRYDLKPIIFLMNNAAYTIEVQIHDGPYNKLNNWHYAQLTAVFGRGHAGIKSFTVSTRSELNAAIETAVKTPHLCFIEVLLDKDDCNKHLLEWGACVARYNSRPPRV